MAVYALGERVPDIHPDAWVHPDAVVIGNVTLGAGASVWPSAVLRGDDREAAYQAFVADLRNVLELRPAR